VGVFSHFFPIIALSAYLLASGLYLCALFSDWKLFSSRNATRVLFVGFLFHIASGFTQQLHNFKSSQGLFAEAGFEPRFANTLFLISCILVATFLIFRKRLQIEKLGAFVAPLAVLFFASSGILFHFEPSNSATAPRGYLLWLHIATTVLGHVAFVFAFGVSLALILQESLIKRRQLFRLQKKLPALIVLDELNAKCLSLGFLLMLLGVLTGLFFASSQGLGLFTFDRRLFWSFFILGIYAALLFSRNFVGIKGRRAAWCSVAGFCAVIASFLSVFSVGGGFHVH